MKSAIASMRRPIPSTTLIAHTACGLTTFPTRTTARSTRSAWRTSWSARTPSTMSAASSGQASNQSWRAAIPRSSLTFDIRSSLRSL
eukprot:4002504-Pleurochrysis_carterae.AAC.1